MSAIDRFFLSVYDESDSRNRQRAKDLVITSSVMGFLLLLLLLFLVPIQGRSITDVTCLGIIGLEMIMLLGLALTRKGSVGIASHLILVPMAAVVWVNLNATSEQKLALDEIAKSIAVINGATQEIALHARELSSTSKGLADQAQELKGLAL
jgi:hypothetical protein